MNAVALTDRGRVRDSNQDTVFAENHPVGALPNLYIVADGMGGHKAGDYASRYLVESLVSVMKDSASDSPLRLLRDSIQRINGELYCLSENNFNLRGMGSTLVTAFFDGTLLYVSNVGDSRAYLFRKNRLKQLTRDHSYVEEMIERGQMIRGSKDYLLHKNYITRAVGTEKELHVDFFEEELMEGDLFFLCSDGLSNMVDNELSLIHI